MLFCYEQEYFVIYEFFVLLLGAVIFKYLCFCYSKRFLQLCCSTHGQVSLFTKAKAWAEYQQQETQSQIVGPLQIFLWMVLYCVQLEIQMHGFHVKWEGKCWQTISAPSGSINIETWPLSRGVIPREANKPNIKHTNEWWTLLMKMYSSCFMKTGEQEQVNKNTICAIN